MILVQFLLESAAKVQLLPIMSEPVRLCCLHYFVRQMPKVKK